MIGKPVTGVELEGLVADEERKGVLAAKINKEIASMKQGECLLYECKEGLESTLGLVLTLAPVSNTRVIERPGKVYVYKEKE